MNNDDLKKMITKFVAMAILEADELPLLCGRQKENHTPAAVVVLCRGMKLKRN